MDFGSFTDRGRGTTGKRDFSELAAGSEADPLSVRRNERSVRSLDSERARLEAVNASDLQLQFISAAVNDLFPIRGDCHELGSKHSCERHFIESNRKAFDTWSNTPYCRESPCCDRQQRCHSCGPR